MDTLQQRIATKFLEKLATNKQVDARTVEQLRKRLTDSQKPKADDFVRIFSIPAGGDIK